MIEHVASAKLSKILDVIIVKNVGTNIRVKWSDKTMGECRPLRLGHGCGSVELWSSYRKKIGLFGSQPVLDLSKKDCAVDFLSKLFVSVFLNFLQPSRTRDRGDVQIKIFRAFCSVRVLVMDLVMGVLY